VVLEIKRLGVSLKSICDIHRNTLGYQRSEKKIEKNKILKNLKRKKKKL
jgi:hypothetical protein